MPREYEFRGQAYICGAYEDKDGCDIIKLQFEVSQQIEVAKLRLLGKEQSPPYDKVLLNLIVKRVNEPPKAKTKPIIKRRKYKG